MHEWHEGVIFAKNLILKLKGTYFHRSDVNQLAKSLLGKYLFTSFGNKLTGGVISETEAYAGTGDKASHAYGGRRTQRTETMYAKGGVAYVYLCYGIHHLFNVVTNVEDVPHAILVRGIRPAYGIEDILKRRKKNKLDKNICSGPGKVSQALGIKTAHTGTPLNGSEIWIEDLGVSVSPGQIKNTPRIGVDYAGEDALLPYRYLLVGELSSAGG